MYSAYNVTPTTAPYEVVSQPVTGEIGRHVVVIKRVGRITSTEDMTSSVHQLTVSVDLSQVVEFEDTPLPLPRKSRKPFMQPSLREIRSPWQARWRLTKQRPRDGLRS